jgi:sporulation protein YlmC with PRC-barrel domain
MRPDSRFIRAIALLSMMSAAPALASEDKTVGRQDTSAKPGSDVLLGISAQRAIDAEVRDRRGDDLGRVHDIILGMDGRAEQVVLSVGGYLGVGDKQVAVPYDALAFAGDDVVLMTVTRQDLEQRPAFSYPEDRKLLVIAAPKGAQQSDDMQQYVRQAREQMQEWQEKVDAYADEVSREGREAAQRARQNVADGWSKVQEQWQRLENASEESWEEAQDGFERARDEFEKAWNESASK